MHRSRRLGAQLLGGLTGLCLLMVAGGVAADTIITGGNVVDQSWNKLGSPYIIQGDVTVPSGAFLHIGEGVEILIASSDSQASEPDVSRVAISVRGEIVVTGTETEPVTIKAQAGVSRLTWHGIVVENTASKARFEWVKMHHARAGLTATNSGLEVVACEFADNQSQGVELVNGAAIFDRVLVHHASGPGIRLTGGTVTMTNVISRNCGGDGFYIGAATLKAYNCASHGNARYGFYSGNSAVVNVVNSLATNNGSTGVRRAAGSLSVSFSNVWGNNTSYSGAVSQQNNISANPQYVNEGLGDLHLQSSSVCIDAGTSVNAPDHDFDNVVRPLDGDDVNASEYDIGPYEYVATAVCGDAERNGNETCDDGAANGSYGFCNDDCDGPGPFCGDGHTDAGEEGCDDGNTSPGDGCDQECELETTGTGGAGGNGGNGAGGAGTGGTDTGGAGTGGDGTGAGSSGTGGNGTATGGAGSGTGGNANSGPCVPGEQVSCACPGGGEEGVQACRADGAGYESCVCSDNGGESVDGSESESGCSVSATRSPSGSMLAFAGLAALGLLSRRRRDWRGRAMHR